MSTKRYKCASGDTLAAWSGGSDPGTEVLIVIATNDLNHYHLNRDDAIAFARDVLRAAGAAPSDPDMSDVMRELREIRDLLARKGAPRG